MTNCSTFQAYAGALREFIREAACVGGVFDTRPSTPFNQHFNDLALALFSLQFAHNRAYRNFCQARHATPGAVTHWSKVPALPTVAFKELDVTSLTAPERIAVFHSSGTGRQPPSRHFHSAQSLALYEASLWPWFQRHLVPEWNTSPGHVPGATPAQSRLFTVLCLTPPPAEAPHSSLVHMFDTVRRELGGPDFRFAGTAVADGSWEVDFTAAIETLESATRQQLPLMLLGTAFSFVHLLDGLAENRRCFELPSGSRVLETGGYKGRSRSLSKPALHALITERLGIPPAGIVCEYGMSELSSQAYDEVASGKPESHIDYWPLIIRPRLSATADCQSPIQNRLFRFPPWARVQVVSPETGREVNEGDMGLIRIFDLANAWSVMAIQTEDLGVRRGDGFELIGRAALAESRGCSLMTS